MSGSIALFMAGIIFIVTVVSGAIPFVLKLNTTGKYDFRVSEALANGIFLGAGLVHLLSDSANGFTKAGINYPLGFVICGATFLLLLIPDHINFISNNKNRNQLTLIAITSNILLSIHGFFAGAALGITTTLSVSTVLFFAILAHKWAASFSLAVHLNQSSLRLSSRIYLFSIFSLMVPLGIYVGHILQHQFPGHIITQPIFAAIAAGTFIYLGTFHGFKKIMTQKSSASLVQYCYMVAGFTFMCLVAIWV